MQSGNNDLGLAGLLSGVGASRMQALPLLKKLVCLVCLVFNLKSGGMVGETTGASTGGSTGVASVARGNSCRSPRDSGKKLVIIIVTTAQKQFLHERSYHSRLLCG